MNLSVSERASLAHDLILSLDDPDDFTLNEEQEREIKKRVEMIKRGKAVGFSSEQVFSEIEAKFR